MTILFFLWNRVDAMVRSQSSMCLAVKTPLLDMFWFMLGVLSSSVRCFSFDLTVSSLTKEQHFLFHLM